MSKPQSPRYSSVEEYVLRNEDVHRTIGNRHEILKIGRCCRVSPETVRGALRRLGFILQPNAKGVVCWQRPQEKP